MKIGVLMATAMACLSVMCSLELNAQCVSHPVTNLVNNGDFSAGNTGFISGYGYCSASNCLYPEGRYAVGQNATFNHNNFVGRDHTTGNGNFMIVNGAPVPNTIIWSQTITVIPNTNYNFSAWVSSLVNYNPASLQFQINGTTIGAVFNAPNGVNNWQNFFVTWNSGANSSAVITILNQSVILSGNDFGLDDISFMEICPTPQPNLGPDKSIVCGTANITLDTNIPKTGTTSVTWSTGVSGTGMGAPYTIIVNAPGKYWVCVQNGTCVKTDTINIVANFAVDLGPDVILCASTSFTIFSSHQNATSSYQWYKDGVLLPDSTRASFWVRSPGTYQVSVHDASCGLTRTDQLTVTSTSAIPIDSKFCPPSSAVFQVTPNPSGEFKWYDAAGNVVGKGNPVSVPGLTATTTMYAEDTAAFQYRVGPNSMFPAGFAQGTSPSYYISFDAHTSFTLNAVTVFAKVYDPNANYTIGVRLRDNTGAIVQSVTVPVVGPPIVPVDRTWAFTVTVNMNIPAGTGWRLTNEGTIGDLYFASGPANAGMVTWNTYKVPGVITLTGMDPGYDYCYVTGSCFPYFYNWEISKGNGCSRVPVMAVKDCPLPLEWISFDAEQEDAGVKLNWVTAHESEVNHFIVERSFDGINYTAIHRERAQNNVGMNEYFHLDNSLSENTTVYYRIVQYDNDGKYTYSKVQVLKRTITEWYVFPNPAEGVLRIFTPEENNIVQIRILNVLGEEMSVVNMSSGETEIPVADLLPGMYFVQAENETEVLVKTFMKK